MNQEELTSSCQQQQQSYWEHGDVETDELWTQQTDGMFL